MSIKNLFNSNKLNKISKSKTTDDIKEVIESDDFVLARSTEFNQFVPPIDFSTASNFAKFGSAELYYEKSFERIHNYYPYDGTLHEKTEFENSSSYLDKYVLENLYPRTNGYLNFDQSIYISVFGGPHTASNGMEGKLFDSTFDLSMKYDESKRRTSAFEYRAEDGITFEFWMKIPTSSGERTIFHVASTSTDGQYKLNYDHTNDKFIFTMASGSKSISEDIMTTVVPGQNTWNHYAFTMQSGSAGVTFRSFKNGKLMKTILGTSANHAIQNILPTAGGHIMRVGNNSSGTGNFFTGSLDEFRFWKTTRTPKQIFDNYFIPVGGGTNKHDSNIDLSVYFKFNEGKTGNDTLDSTILDYSGRINNGILTGSSYTYSSAYRSTSSAITEKLSQTEFMDPIVYSSHPDVVSKKAEYKASGSLADHENTNMLIKYLPGWMQEEDEQNGNQLKYLCQVMASHLDTVWHQIDYLNKIKDKQYIEGANKPLPFAQKLLESEGFYIPDLFSDATMLEKFRNKDENEVYERDIEEVKNTIYQNIYNSISHIYKSKGTEKSFRNFFNSLGLGHNVVKLNKYADDSTFVLRNNYNFKSHKKRFLNFYDTNHYDATIFDSSSVGIPGDKNYSGSFSAETEIILPNKPTIESPHFSAYGYLSSSIFGFHATGSSYNFPATDYDAHVVLVRETLEGSLRPNETQRIKFVLKGAFGEVSSPYFDQQYEGNKWNLALRVKHASYPFASVIGITPSDFKIELYGVEAEANDKKNYFLLTASTNANTYQADKIFYAGAHRTNYTGSIITSTDIKMGYLRYWHSYISDDAIDQHAFDTEAWGINEPFENDLVNTYTQEIPREKTLSFHWAFDTITSSNSSGKFTIPDLSSGSSGTDYGSLSATIQRYKPARAFSFATSSTEVVDSEFVYSANKRRPDDLMSSDLITFKNDETKNFFVDDDVSDNFYSFEKSLYGSISDQMMNMFSTALDYNNLIGQPNFKFHTSYSLLDFLRDRFFDDVENEPSIEKFTSFYKWIDESISIALEQLMPAGSRFSEKINNIVESHILERNKYQHQVPIVTDYENTEGSIKGITELKYNWQYGHAPFNVDEEQNHCLWQKERKVKSTAREPFRTTKNNHSIQSSGILRREINGSTRLSDVYSVRKFGKLYDVSLVSKSTIHAGTNYSRKKNLMLFKEAIAPAGALGAVSSAPQNIITVGVGTGSGIVRPTRCEDDSHLKKKYSGIAKVGNQVASEYGHVLKTDFVLPFNFVSGTIHTGYNKLVKSFFASDVIISNLHVDAVGNDNDVGMQGPFTNAHVGGLAYRHIDLNRYDTSKSVSYRSAVAGNLPTGSIQFNATVLEAKRAAGTGSWVQLKDADGTITRAHFSNVFDLYDNQWSNMDELVRVLNHRLDIETNKISNSILNVTQSTSGSSYNYTIQTANSFITASGFAGGTNLNYTMSTRKLDSRQNRPEGWGIEFKDHPSLGDTDGALGFIGPDYGSPYPYSGFPKAAGYRDEVAKRPVNLRNIKTTSASVQVGNYKHGQEIFQIQPYHQKTWAKRAYDDSAIDLIPSSVSSSLPDTTNYQTLIGRDASNTGNVFGQMNNNRQIDQSLGTPLSLAINSAETSAINHRLASDTTVSGYSTTGNKSISFWVNLDSTSTTKRYAFTIYNTTGAADALAVFFQSNSLQFFTRSTGGSKTFKWTVTMSNFLNTWKHVAIVWDGNQSSSPTLYINGSSEGSPDSTSGSGTGTTLSTMNGISVFDRFGSASTGNELQGSLMNLGVWEAAFTSGNVTTIYNSGIVLSAPILQGSLIDFYLLGNELSGLAVGNSVANGTVISSSYGSGNNHLVAQDGLVIVQGLQTQSRLLANYIAPERNNTIEIPRTDLTGSEHNITTRFSAPGGPEIQSIGYLDAYSQTFSVYNAMPFRNLSVLGSGSGETGTIRVVDHLGHRRGLKTLLALHMGQFGSDSTYGSISSLSYVTNGSFNKQIRNRSRRYEWNDSSDVTASLSQAGLITGSAYDNMFINTPIPRSELQYSWINAAITGSDSPTQRILGYAPEDGIVSSSAGFVEAIVFPSASSIFAD